MHGQVRGVLIQDRPDEAAAVCFGDQRIDLIVGEKAFRCPHPDLNQLFESRTIAESRSIGVDKKEQDVAGTAAASEGI